MEFLSGSSPAAPELLTQSSRPPPPQDKPCLWRSGRGPWEGGLGLCGVLFRPRCPCEVPTQTIGAKADGSVVFVHHGISGVKGKLPSPVRGPLWGRSGSARIVFTPPLPGFCGSLLQCFIKYKVVFNYKSMFLIENVQLEQSETSQTCSFGVNVLVDFLVCRVCSHHVTVGVCIACHLALCRPRVPTMRWACAESRCCVSRLTCVGSAAAFCCDAGRGVLCGP